MKKILLIILLTGAVNQLDAQYFRLTYYLNGCPGNPLTGATGIYLYAGAGTLNSTSTYDYTAGTFAGDSLPLQDMGSNTWEICFDPYQVFRDVNGVLMPMGTTIFNFEINFRDSAGTTFTGQCGSGAYIKIDNPMTSPQTIFPNIVHGQPVATCVVGISELDNSSATITNFPNPMQSGSVFQLSLVRNENVTLQVFNILGKKVRTLIDHRQLSGLQQINFNGCDDHGNKLFGGCYFYVLSMGDTTLKSGRLLILK